MGLYYKLLGYIICMGEGGYIISYEVISYVWGNVTLGIAHVVRVCFDGQKLLHLKGGCCVGGKESC